jgi:HupE/UreJ protein
MSSDVGPVFRPATRHARSDQPTLSLNQRELRRSAVALAKAEDRAYVPRRTRLRPGPLVAAIVVWWTLGTVGVRAHDPGLSSLDVDVRSAALSVSLSIASTDVTLIARDAVDPRMAVGGLARTAVHISLDGVPLTPSAHEVQVNESGVRVEMRFSVPRSSEATRRLTIGSDVPRRLAQGHRELLVVHVDGSQAGQALLDAVSNSFAIDLSAASVSAPRLAWSFLKLGNRHILSGYDHLLFLAGLFLAASTVRELVVLLSAFTLAHSISLALVVVGGVHLPASIVEPLIAASIAWVGLENLVRERHAGRWLVVFGFGLIHGFGFADALMDLGFGSTAADVAVALLSFNTGVESGQLVVAAFVLPLIWTMRSRPIWRAKLQPLCSMLIAVAGGFWAIVRLI